MSKTSSGRQVTTGTPIGVFIENTDQRSKDYGEIKDNTAPVTPITSMTPNMESAITAAAGAPRRARPRRASPQAPWRAK